MDIGGWLRSLGLEQYEAAFRENEIDETVLPSLTAEDLKDLASLLGHRRKLLDAIAAPARCARTRKHRHPRTSSARIPTCERNAHALTPPTRLANAGMSR